jgi:hypothetical protein
MFLLFFLKTFPFRTISKNDGNSPVDNNVDGYDKTTFLKCGHQRINCYSPRWYMRVDNYGGMISTGKSSWFVQQSHLVPNQEELEKEMMNFSLHSRPVSFILWTFFYMPQTLSVLLPIRMKTRCVFWSPLKVYCPRPGLNPRTLGLMASTLITRPRSTVSSPVNFVMSVYPL